MAGFQETWEAFVSRAFQSKAIFLQFKDIIQPAMFKDTVLSQVFGLLGGFFSEYKRLPSQSEMLAWLRTLPSSEQERVDLYKDKIQGLYNRPLEFGDDVLIPEVTEAIRRSMIEEVILEGAEMVDAGKVNYEGLLGRMKDIISVSVDSDLGYEINIDPKGIIQKATAAERFEYVPTGITGADRVLRGGWFKRQFSCGIGPSGVGKSAFLLNHAVGAATAGKNCVVVTCELPDLTVIERVLRRLTKMDRPQLTKEQDKAAGIVERFFRFTHSRLIVKYARPGRFAVVDLELYLDKLQMMKEFVPDLVVIDYLDELRPSADDRRKEIRHQHHGLARDLGGLAKDRGVAVVSATQTNRQALGKRRLTEKDVGEDYGKIKVSDAVYAICQTEEEMKANRARMTWLKVRDGPGKGREVPVRVDFSKMLVESLEPRTYSEEEIQF